MGKISWGVYWFPWETSKNTSKQIALASQNHYGVISQFSAYFEIFSSSEVPLDHCEMTRDTVGNVPTLWAIKCWLSLNWNRKSLPFKAKYWQKNLFFPGQFCAISRHVTSHHTCAIFQTNYVQISSFFKKGQNRVVVERSLKFGTTETGEGGDVRATVGGG